MANILTKKAGPLPVWAWGTIVVGVAIGYKLFRGSSASSGATSTSGYTTDAEGNIYDAEGNLVSGPALDSGTAPATTPDVSNGGVGDTGGNGYYAPAGGTLAATSPAAAAPDTTVSDALTGVLGLAGQEAGSLEDVAVTSTSSLGDVASTLADSQSAVVQSLATSPAVVAKAPVIPTVKPAVVKTPVTVSKVTKLANGGTVTTYSDGHEVESGGTAKTPYTIKKAS